MILLVLSVSLRRGSLSMIMGGSFAAFMSVGLFGLAFHLIDLLHRRIIFEFHGGILMVHYVSRVSRSWTEVIWCDAEEADVMVSATRDAVVIRRHRKRALQLFISSDERAVEQLASEVATMCSIPKAVNTWH